MRYHGNQKNFWLITGFILLWNSGFIGGEFGLPYAGVFTLMFYRYSSLTLLLFLYLYVTKKLIWVGVRYAGEQMIIGVLAHGVWLTCVLIAIDYGVPVGIVALVVALQPLATGAFSGIVVGEPTSWKQWLGLVIGFTGVALPLVSHVNFQEPSQVFAWFIPLGSVISITAASLFQRKIYLNKDYPQASTGLSLFYQCLATMVAVTAPAVFVEKLSVKWNPVFISSLIWLVVGVSLGAYALMWILIDRMNITKVASLFYLGPPVTMLMAWVAFGDKVKGIDIIGLSLVFVGVSLTYLKHSAPSNHLKNSV